MRNFYKSNTLLAAICALIVMLIAIDVYVFRSEPLIFWVSLPFLLGVSGLALGKLFQIRQSEYIYFDQLSQKTSDAGSIWQMNFPLPVCIVNENRNVICSNELFNELFFRPSEDESSIDCVTEMPLDLFGSDGREICCKTHAEDKENKDAETEMWFRVYSVSHDENITLLIFRDITEFKSLQNTYEMTKPIVMLVAVDNYEELLSGAKESERANVTIQVDRLIEEYFAEKKAVLRKVTGDKFLIVLEQQYLQEMIRNKMDIIDKAREIKVRENASITLSIGVGTTARTLAEGERFAREMLEKAFDRGGDRALIKKTDGYEQCSTNSKAREQRTSKVKIRLATENIMTLISGADTVYIMGHCYGDYDSAGSAIGLTCAIRALGIPAYTVARFRDGSKTNAKALFDRFAEYDTPVAVEPEEAKRFITAKSVLIIVDTHIEKNLEDKELFEMANKNRVVIIDHHLLSAAEIKEFGVRCHEPHASSASEIVTEIIQYFGSSPLLKPVEAEALLAGITLDTKDFVMRAGVATFEAAAYLKKLGADTVNVKKLFDMPIEDKLKKSEIVSSAAMYRARYAIAVVEQDFPRIRVLCSQAADEMLYIRNVDASFTVYPIENGWSISARSLGKVDVQIIMEKLVEEHDAGGGHQSMAGAQLYNMELEEVIDKLHKAIDECLDSKNNKEKQ